MKKETMMNKIRRNFNKAKMSVICHSPEILIVAGIAGVVTSTVMACRATTKAGAILEELKESLDDIHKVESRDQTKEEYSLEDGRKDRVIVYTKMAVKLAKLYAPSMILGTLSITSILTSHNILRKRNAALAAAYATVDKGFREYRKRVAERFGEDVDRELRYNIKAKEIEETIIDEDGNEKTVKNTVEVASLSDCSPYARYFDEHSPYWEEDSEYNLLFLRSEQSYVNDLLKIKGFLTLNEVYERLGIPTTKAGMVVGWIYNEDNPDGDNYVDFGLYETNRETVKDFNNGYTNVILLDFNVDGNIFEKM